MLAKQWLNFCVSTNHPDNNLKKIGALFFFLHICSTVCYCTILLQTFREQFAAPEVNAHQLFMVCQVSFYCDIKREDNRDTNILYKY